MAEIDWFNKPVENSRELILKEAFKLFLQKNVEKVTVPELERVTKLQKGAIFIILKIKKQYSRMQLNNIFPQLNIFYPINSNTWHSLEEYWDKKNEHLNKIQNWFEQESIPISPYSAFFTSSGTGKLIPSYFQRRYAEFVESRERVLDSSIF